MALAPNGVLSPKQTTKALRELFTVEPNLALGIKSVEKFVLLLSRGLRTLMAWYRQYCKGDRKAILKQCPDQEAFLDKVVENMVLTNSAVCENQVGLIVHPTLRIFQGYFDIASKTTLQNKGRMVIFRDQFLILGLL